MQQEFEAEIENRIIQISEVTRTIVEIQNLQRDRHRDAIGPVEIPHRKALQRESDDVQKKSTLKELEAGRRAR